MGKDLTAILLSTAMSTTGSTTKLIVSPSGGETTSLTPEFIEETVRKRGRPVLLRIAPLDKLGLTQVEVCDVNDGLPSEDPELVAQLSVRNPVTFVHVNHEADQAIIHSFDDGKAGESFIGKPGPEFEQKLVDRLGHGLEALHAADDQSRAGIGIIASRTAALLPGRTLPLPMGMPSALGSFAFHDSGGDPNEEVERCAFFAFDRPLVDALSNTPGNELAGVVEASSAQRKGADEDPNTKQIISVLRALGDRTLKDAEPADRPMLVRAIEMLVLGSGRIFAGGDRATYWDERILPLLSLKDSEPVVDNDDLDALTETESLLHALVEVVPYDSPPGGPGEVIESIGNAELSPLLPQLAVGGSYAGSVLRLDATRLRDAVRQLDGERLSSAVAKLERAWYSRKTGQAPEGDAFQAFRRERGEPGQPDIDRVLRHLSELRIVLEVAEVNDLDVALAFYG